LNFKHCRNEQGKEPGVEIELRIFVPNKGRIAIIRILRFWVHSLRNFVAELRFSPCWNSIEASFLNKQKMRNNSTTLQILHYQVPKSLPNDKKCHLIKTLKQKLLQQTVMGATTVNLYFMVFLLTLE